MHSRRDFYQRNQIALRKDGKIAPTNSCPIAWKKRTGECDQGWPIPIGSRN